MKRWREIAHLSSDGQAALRRLAAIALVLLTALLVWLLALLPELTSAAERSQEATWQTVVVVLILYVLATLVLAPNTALTVAATLALGFPLSVPIALAGATIGAVGCSMVGAAAGAESLDTVQDELDLPQTWPDLRRSTLIVLFVRVSPLFPYNIVNYVLGMSRAPLVAMVVGTAVGILPRTTVTALATSGLVSGSLNRILTALAALAVVTIAALVWAKHRRGTAARA